MKKIYTVIFCLVLVPQLALTQYYIVLSEKNTVRYKNAYLIIAPVAKLTGASCNLFIQDTRKLIPTKAYSGFRSNQNFLRIDTIFISHKLPRGKQGFEPSLLQKGLTEYVTNPYFNNLDTLEDADNRFRQYKLLNVGNVNKKDSVLIYYEEGNGSDGVKLNSMFLKNKIEYFVATFEKKHHVKVGESYVVPIGGEGEATTYFSLSGLTVKQKLEFIYERECSLLHDEEKTETLTIQKIYTPFWMSINELKSPLILTHHDQKRKLQHPRR